jgi:hypothetical protein
MRLPKSPETVTLDALSARSRKVTVRSALTTGDFSMVEVAEEVGVDGCDVKVAVGPEVTTGEICSTEFAEEAGIVEEDIGLARVQPSRSIVKHSITKPDRSRLMKCPPDLARTLAGALPPEHGAIQHSPVPRARHSGRNGCNVDQTFSFSLLVDFRISRTGRLTVGASGLRAS